MIHIQSVQKISHNINLSFLKPVLKNNILINSSELNKLNVTIMTCSIHTEWLGEQQGWHHSSLHLFYSLVHENTYACWFSCFIVVFFWLVGFQQSDKKTYLMIHVLKFCCDCHILVVCMLLQIIRLPTYKILNDMENLLWEERNGLVAVTLVALW